MYGVIFFRGIAACELEYDLGATGVGGEEFGDIPNIAIEYHPAVIGAVVLCNWRNCQRRTGQAGIQIVPSAASNIFAMLIMSEYNT
jgi:hypothetical protein